MTSVELDVPAEYEPELMTSAEVMRLLRIVSPITLGRYIKAGMPAHQPLPGGPRLFDKAEVIGWIKSRWTAKTADQQASGGDPNGDAR